MIDRERSIDWIEDPDIGLVRRERVVGVCALDRAVMDESAVEVLRAWRRTLREQSAGAPVVNGDGPVRDGEGSRRIGTGRLRGMD